MRKRWITWGMGLSWVLCSLSPLQAGSEENMQNQVQQQQLKNGLTVLTKAVRNVPVVSIYIWYGVGVRHEPAGQSGLAHFLEHMLFKGTTKFPKGEIARRIDRTGGRQNAFTSHDYTAYYETVPAEYMALALEIEADRMQHALLEAQDIEQERTVILSELDGNQNSPRVRFREQVQAQTWTRHPYRRPVIGWRDEVARLTREQLIDFYHRHYRPDNATLVVVGDFDSQELNRQIQKYFEPISRQPQPVEIGLPAENSKGERRLVVRDYGPVGMVQINVSVPPAKHSDHFAITVLNDALVKGKTSRLYKSLVVAGLATEVSAAPYEMVDPGPWTFYAVCQRGIDPRRVEKVIQDELARVRTEPLLPREFQQSVNQTRAQLIYAKDSLSDQAMMLGYYQTVAQDWRLPEIYPERVAEVTPEQVQQAARQYLDPSRMTIGYFIPLTSTPGSGDEDPGNPEQVSHARVLPDAVWHISPRFEAMPPSGIPGPTSDLSSVQATEAGSGGKRYVLDNGLVLLIHSNPSNPTVSLSGLIRGGTTVEPEHLPGLAQVHARMLDRGSTSRTAEQLAAALEYKGAELSFSAGPQELNLTGQALSEDLDLLLSVLAECLRQPAFPAPELKTIVPRVVTLCHVAEDDAGQQAWQGFYDQAYPPRHPQRRSLLIGAESGVKKIKRQDVQAYHQRWILPNTMILSLAGNVDPEAVYRLVQQRFGSWTADTSVLDPVIPPMRPVPAMVRTEHNLPGKSESIVIMGHEGIHRKDPEYYRAFLANYILGGRGLSSLLMQGVREEAGLTYSIYSQFQLLRGIRPWCVVFQSDPDHVEQAVDMTRKIIRHMHAGEVSQTDLADTQEQLVGGLALSLETNMGIAHINREVEYHELGSDYLQTYCQGIRSVTYGDMIKAAQKWLHPDNCIVSVAGPKAKLTPSPVIPTKNGKQ